jgi:PAS domain S-box-containing protein
VDSPFWRQIIDHVAYPNFVKDRDFRFVFVNRALCEMLGVPRDELVGKTDDDFFPPEQAAFFRQKDAEMFQRDAAVVIAEEPLTDARGEQHVLSTIKAPLHGEDGEITHLVGIIHDITPLKRVEDDLRRANDELSAAQSQLRDRAGSLEQLLREKTAELQRRHDQLEAILGSLGEGVLVADGAGGLRRQNAAARALTGLPDEEVVQLGIEGWAAALSLRWPDGRPVADGELPLRRALLGEAVHNAQLQLRPRGGQDAWVLLSAAPLPGGGAVCALRDVSELKEAERLKEEFLQVASHELRTPLASLKLLLGAVKAQLKDERGAALLPLLGRGHQMVERMRRLINDILDASRLQRRKLHVEMRALDLAALVRDAVERARAATCSDHALVAETCEGTLRVRGDGDRLDQVLGNLLANACKYAPAGTTITARCEARDGAALVSVHDEGPGVPPELQERIFERFYQIEARAGRSFGGLGLGLYISRELLVAHGGRIWVESQPGQGSTFFFCLPMLEQ